MLNLHPPTAGTLAQLVEQRTENPCVPGSIPGGTTQKTLKFLRGFFVFKKQPVLFELRTLFQYSYSSSLLHTMGFSGILIWPRVNRKVSAKRFFFSGLQVSMILAYSAEN